MPKKIYTIMVIPNITGKFRSFSIPSYLLKGIFFTSLILIGIAVFLFNHYIVMTENIYELKKLRKETREQAIEIQKFSQEIKNLGIKMTRLQTLDKKLRIITSLEKPKDKTTLVGIGGPTGSEFSDLNTVSENQQKEMIHLMQEELKQLKTDVSKQELSFLELEGFLRDQKSLLSSTPAIWPTRGWLTSTFGYRKSPFTGKREMHEGLDIATRLGTPIYATADGVVVKTGMDRYLGKYVEIDHGYGFVTKYGHNSRVLVRVGQKVKRWQKIATVGNTGRSTGSHVHYEVKVNGIPVNPLRYIID